MPRIDILSPAFFSGLIGYAATGEGIGFWLSAAGVWVALAGFVLIAAAIAKHPEASGAIAGTRTLEPAE